MAGFELGDAGWIGRVATDRSGDRSFGASAGTLDPRQRQRKSILAHEVKGYASGDGSASRKAQVLTDRATDDK